jgi:hypothetical protein
VNRHDGKADAFSFDPSEWIFKASGPDIAISPPIEFNDKIHDVKYFSPNWFMTSEEEVKREIGPGEDVFMIGRFIDYDGVQTNVPAARFGHISMMDAKIKQTTGYAGRSIVLDMHSRSGYSGSPVLVYRTIGSEFFDHKPGSILTGGGHYISLLGIHYAQFPEVWDLKSKKDNDDPVVQAALKADTHYVEGLSGMTCVVPANDILSLLFGPELTEMRRQREKRYEVAIKAKLAAEAGAPKTESAAAEAPQSSDANPNHREDFMRLQGAAAQKQKPDG